MTMIIRKAEASDGRRIAEFNNLLAEESEGKTLDAETIEDGVAAMLADSNKGSYYIAEEAGQVLGQIGITYEWSDWRHGWFWWIQSVYVRKEARRRGVFSALYHHLEDLARRDPSVIGLRLYVEEENKSAQETYYKLGMQRTGYFVLEKYPLD